MKKYIAKMLRRAAHRLDPAPRPTFKLFEPETYSTTAQSMNFKVVDR